MNYWITGLISDQSLGFTWQYADLERLNKWGIIPNIIMVMWIRDNYDKVAVPWDVGVISNQLVQFMRLDVMSIIIWFTLSFCAFYFLYMIIRKYFFRKKILSIIPQQEDQALKISLNQISIMLFVFAALSVVVGHSQNVSFFRFSTFFFPLVVLIIALVWLRISPKNGYVGTLIPIFILILTLTSWPRWGGKVTDATRNALRFMRGHYSLFTAYKNLPWGLSFGGVNPGAYAAFKQAPKGARIWSTNVDSYCMVPDCIIESVISFKLSSNVNEILNGPPEVAKKILKNEKLNYFIVSNNSQLIDVLPFSHLFSPVNIRKYLGIKWTDGETYLLTWKENAIKPIDKKFMNSYVALIKHAQSPWFRFDEMMPELDKTMKNLSNLPHPWNPIEFSWRKQQVKIDA